ncbi:MAG: glutamine synthetase beta-grasp domain-containing protein, partial [Myxococcales bacterium]|nr:glutamine synthetase beta-grasp domain-containing protein [Myxococcales bacterium]
MRILAEYIWVDGTRPTAQLRSKTRVMGPGEVPPSTELKEGTEIDPSVFPEWGADGSSTNQAGGSDSDIGLKPVRAVPDPIRKGHYLVLCEVFDGGGAIHETNTRAKLRQVLDNGGAESEAWFGFEQEYTFLDRTLHPLGFPPGGYPGPQGPYYCAVGSQWIYGRKVYEEFLQACLDAQLEISGVNWEVMPGQAEFQIGAAGALIAPDHMWLARWLLLRIAEDHKVIVSFSPKPAVGDWNGAGMHTNFST